MISTIIRGDSFNPWHNLAVEELLFETLDRDEIVFYLWQNQNTVVIGRHQNAWQECRVKLLEDEGGRLARRSTGGGAVFHDLGNLNFTFVVSREHYDVHRQLEVIRRAVATFGIDTAFTGRNDLVVTSNGAKFSGNAFKFSGNVGLHHGTVLVDADMTKLGRYLVPGSEKLKAKGIESVRSRVCNLAELNPSVTITALIDAMEMALKRNMVWQSGFSFPSSTRVGWRPWRQIMPLGISDWGMRCPLTHDCPAVSNGEKLPSS